MQHITDELIEKVSDRVHEKWMETKHSQGVKTRRSENNEELMVPYSQLSEGAKDLDRNSVRAVLSALEEIERGNQGNQTIGAGR
jgi:hypothetical protein